MDSSPCSLGDQHDPKGIDTTSVPLNMDVARESRTSPAATSVHPRAPRKLWLVEEMSPRRFTHLQNGAPGPRRTVVVAGEDL